MWDNNINISQVFDSAGHPMPAWTFDDNTDNNIMGDKAIEDRFYHGHNLKAITVTDFIQQCFMSGDDSPILKHLYAPILGTRKVLIKHCYRSGALDHIKIIKWNSTEL
jgi:hypothetical protein